MSHWRDVVGLEGWYKVSDQGEVRSVARRIWVSDCKNGKKGYYRYLKCRLIKPLMSKHANMDKPRFVHVCLWREHNSYQYSISELVLSAFVGPRPLGLYACHKDDDQRNNKLENLYWGTPIQNCADKVRNGNQPRGSLQASSKLTESDVIAIRLMSGTYSQEWLANHFGVGQSQINRIISGQQWRHILCLHILTLV